MDSNEFEAGQRAREWFHGLRIPPGMWTIIRVDGRSFTKLTAELEKPFDEQFHRAMVGVAEQLLIDLDGVYAYTESDEISVVLPPKWDLFARSVEKVVSISAGLASATFTLLSYGGMAGRPMANVGVFDSRVWMGAGVQDVVDYMSWRQSDAARCCLNGWCYWTLRKAGFSAAGATSTLKGWSGAQKQDHLHEEHDINFNDLPVWQRRGSGLWWEPYTKKGVNPVTEEVVFAHRRRVKRDDELPMGDEYRALVGEVIRDAVPDA